MVQDVSAGASVVMTTNGDMVKFASGVRTRHPIGSANQILQVKSSLPSWETISFPDSILTTQGDILYENASGLARLGAGTSGYFLKTQGGSANPVWAEVASGGNVDILGQTDLSAQATEIEVLVTQSNIPDDYAFFRVIGGGDTTGSCNANFTIKSAGSYLSEYHQNAIQNKLGTGSDIYLGSDNVLELQSTAEINVARNFNFVIDINGNNATGVQWVWNMTGITGCVNLSHRTFSCGTAVTGASGLEFDGCKIALDNSENFEAEGYMTVLGFKSA